MRFRVEGLGFKFVWGSMRALQSFFRAVKEGRHRASPGRKASIRVEGGRCTVTSYTKKGMID